MVCRAHGRRLSPRLLSGCALYRGPFPGVCGLCAALRAVGALALGGRLHLPGDAHTAYGRDSGRAAALRVWAPARVVAAGDVARGGLAPLARPTPTWRDRGAGTGGTSRARRVHALPPG